MKALFIGDYPNPVEPYRSVFFRELIYQMARMGVECTVVSPVSITKYRGNIKRIPKCTEEILEEGYKIRVLYPRCISYSAKKIGRINTYKYTVQGYVNAAMRQMRHIDTSFDFIYCHFLLCAGLTGAKIGQKYGIPTYIAYGECSYESEVSDRYRELTHKDVEGVRGIISVSTKNTAELRSHSCFENIPIFLALNSVNKAIFTVRDQKSCREKFGMSQNDFIIGFVGYFIERKGSNRVEEACRGLDGVKLAFAGKGPLQPEGENVVFCEGLKHEDVADFLNAVDVFVLPTLHEGCCNAVIEAMSCGKAIVSSDLPFNHDVLNRENSFLVDPLDVGQIREAIMQLRDDRMLLRQMGERVLQDAEELTIDRRTQKILDFIKSTM